LATIPFSDTASATSDSAGNVTFSNFQQPRLGMWRTGAFTVVRSDGVALTPPTQLPISWKEYVGATLWGGFYNDNPSNLVQTNGPPVKVTGINVPTSTALQCIFTGYDSDSPAALAPQPVPAPPPSPPQILISTLTGTATPLTPSGITTILNGVPVVVGTSLEVESCTVSTSGGPNIWQLELSWGPTAAAASVGFTMDVDASVPTAIIQGLVVPNLDSFLFVRMRIGAMISPAARMQILTGLPPITRETLVTKRLLLDTGGTLLANGTTAVPFTQPYMGPAVFSASFSNPGGTAGTHPVILTFQGTDYAATVYPWGVALPDYLSDNTGAQMAVLNPRLIFVPPLANTVTLISQNPNNLTYAVNCVAIGP
jgi:hypothetical protein